MHACDTLILKLIAAALVAALLAKGTVAADPADSSTAAEAFQSAEALFVQGDYGAAIPLYRRVTASGNRELRIRSHMRLAEAHGKLGLLVEAVQDGLNARGLLKDAASAELRAMDLRLGEGTSYWAIMPSLTDTCVVAWLPTCLHWGWRTTCVL